MNQKEREGFGEYLRSLRMAQKLTQRQAAELIEISAPYLAQLERGQRNPPSRDILGRLAEVYNADHARVLLAAGLATEGEQQRAVATIDARRLDWAFSTLMRDPSFVIGTRMKADQITPEVKAWAVELYLRKGNLTLLTEEELKALKEMIGYAEPNLPSGDFAEQREQTG